jgi:D-alanyl-D-alanine dipeptidase
MNRAAAESHSKSANEWERLPSLPSRGIRLHRFLLAAVFLGTVLLRGAPVLDDGDLVDVRTVHPGIRLDIRYATTNNFTGQKIYAVANCFLRRGTAGKLGAVQRGLERDGLGLKVFDGYRPLSAQRVLWKRMPDSRYVANPDKGSRHNRGTAVDVTLVDRNGVELPMPTAYDDFTPKARRDFTELPPAVMANRARLERIMVKHGFIPLSTEWWHFDDADWEKYGILDIDTARLSSPGEASRAAVTTPGK